MPRSKPPGSSGDIPNDLQIVSYMHCAKCSAEWKAGKAPGQSMATYRQLSVGFSKIGMQIWCDRHSMNVAHIDFQGATHPANITAKEENGKK